MESYPSIYQDITNLTHGKVILKKHFSPTAPVCLAAGIGMLAVAFMLGDGTSSRTLLLATAGIALLSYGLFRLLVLKKRFFFTPTRVSVDKKALYFRPEEAETVQRLIEGRQFEQLSRLPRQQSSGIRLEALCSADGRFSALQTFAYVPHHYEAVSPVNCYYEEDARRLKDALCSRP